MKIAVAAAAILFLITAPNTLWLVRSTVRIENRTREPLQWLRLRLESSATAPVDVAPASARLVLLPAHGETTLSVSFRAGGAEHEGCTEYVQGSMYHVTVTVEAGFVVRCHVELPIFSRLVLVELLRTFL